MIIKINQQAALPEISSDGKAREASKGERLAVCCWEEWIRLIKRAAGGAGINNSRVLRCIGAIGLLIMAVIYSNQN